MSQKYRQQISDVATETFENLAFMFLLPEEDKPELSGVKRTVSVNFDGPFDGAVMLRASEEILPPLASNMLGLMDESECTEAIQIDAFKELLNVICGNLLPTIAGEEAVFNVQAPQIIAGETIGAHYGQFVLAGQSNLVLDSGEVELALYVAQAVETA